MRCVLFIGRPQNRNSAIRQTGKSALLWVVELWVIGNRIPLLGSLEFTENPLKIFFDLARQGFDRFAE
jgi:hypothetical protein